MARGGQMFLIVFTLIIALATGLLFFSWLQTGSAKKETVVEKKQVEQVVVAKQDIAGQTCLTREMLEIKTLYLAARSRWLTRPGSSHRCAYPRYFPRNARTLFMASSAASRS